MFLNHLKKFNKEKICHNPKIKTESNKIKNMFLQLFERYLEDLKCKRKGSLIRHFLEDMRAKYRKTNKKRIVTDFID